MNKGWIGVDLDGTLAQYHGWTEDHSIGAPVELMVERIKSWLAQGVPVRIFTARVAHDEDGSVAKQVQEWCLKHIGVELPVTNKKDYSMIELWDDRAVKVVANTGERCCNN